MAISTVEMLVRMAVAILLSSTIGFERERTGRHAGLRTHVIVALASSLFMLVSTQFVFFQHYTRDSLVAIDTSRIAASVVAGIGFLGAGAILRTGLSIQGLTTAATLWLVAAVGLASGGGMFAEAVAATAVALVTLIFLRRVESKPLRLLQRRVTIAVEGGVARTRESVERIRAHRIDVSDIEYDCDRLGKSTTMTCDVQLADSGALTELAADLESLEGVRRVEFSRIA